MLQIVIWGICIMLVVKAFDMWQRQSLAKDPESGATEITVIGTVIALVGAGILFILADGQVSEMPSAPYFGG